MTSLSSFSLPVLCVSFVGDPSNDEEDPPQCGDSPYPRIKKKRINFSLIKKMYQLSLWYQYPMMNKNNMSEDADPICLRDPPCAPQFYICI
uniref:Uncharacterized protein n=1 Tax=Picea glauca TaxID=3330 RepID=A0A101LXA9_PICGL|nr:hypothetical protein ABT39_MTgene6075 [Picea glauca]